MMNIRRVTAHLVTATVVAATVLGCSSEKSDKEDKYTSAESVCDGALDKQAAKDLKTATGTSLFEESKNPNDGLRYYSELADTLTSDLNKSAKKSPRRLCFVAPGGMSGAPFVIDFGWGEGKTMKAFPPAGEESMRFKEFDALIFETSAHMAFPCPVEGKSAGHDVLLQARIAVTAKDDPASVSNRRAEARLLHSAALKMATEMGCRKESGLPQKLDRLTPVPAKS